MAIEIPFATYEGASAVRQNSQERLLNMYAEVEISGAKRLIRRQRAALNRGLANSGTKRCVERHKDKHYFVIGNKLHSFDGTSLTELGTLASSAGRCTMVFNDNDQIMVSDGAAGYCWDGETLIQVSSPYRIGYLAYQGGFALFNVPGTGQFAITGLNDFSSVDALDFATAESYPDDLVRVFVDHNEVWLFGKRSVEVWQLSGNPDFPFQRFTNAQIERGIGASLSVAADDNTVFWLGDDWQFYRAEGYRPQVISNPTISRLIEEVPVDVRQQGDAFVYTIQGVKFYTISFPGYLTLQFNIATGFWNAARTWGYDDWRVMGSAGHYVDYYLTPGGICTLEYGLSKDEGGILERGGISAPVYANGSRITFPEFHLEAEMGRAAMNIPAQIMMRVAPDGETFGNERWRSFGSTGDYIRRAVWRGLGQGRKFALQLSMTDPTEFKIIGTFANLKASQ